MPSLSKAQAIEFLKSDERQFYYKASSHYNNLSSQAVHCDYCHENITGGCVGNTDVGEAGIDICLKCVSDLCVIISRRSNSSSSNLYNPCSDSDSNSSSSDSDSDTSSSDANTNTNTNTNTIEDDRKKVRSQM